MRRDLPLNYMMHCLFAHLAVYMMAVISKNFLYEDPALIRPLVYQGVLNELGEKKEHEIL